MRTTRLKRSPVGFERIFKRSPHYALPITYQEAAKGLLLSPPNTIHQITEALEQITAEDAGADRPFIAAMVISKRRGGLLAPGFFDCAARTLRRRYNVSGRLGLSCGRDRRGVRLLGAAERTPARANENAWSLIRRSGARDTVHLNISVVCLAGKSQYKGR
ncbi:MAG: hypothetical protein ACI9JL_004255 [Paracoccaceae bacterium]